MSEQLLPQFDTTEFSTDSYLKRVDKPWGYELHLVPPETPYMLKVIHISEGARLSLQVHDEKSESWTVVQGRAAVIWENASGELVTTELEPGVGYTTKVGQRHRLMGITDCEVIEASTPELGTTWRLEDDYARPHETPVQRAIERGEP
jgi:mannose-6-phosphate isomerase-like protein (cupin superfamily)